MIEIDKKDRLILYLLDLNSRQSLKKIGKKIRIHENSIRYRISRLEKMGIIKGYYTAIDSFKLGYIVIRLYISLNYCSSKIRNEISNHFIKNELTWVVNTDVHGDFDIVALIWVKNINQFYNFWKKTLQAYGKYIQNKVISHYFQARLYKPTYLINESEREEGEILLYETGGSRAINIDDFESNILKVMSNNAQISLTELSLKVNSSITTVSKKIKKFQQLGIIQGYRILIDQILLGYEGYKIDIYLKEYSTRKKIVEYVEKNPFIYSLNTTTYSDIELECYFRDVYHLRTFMYNVEDTFPEDIKYYKFFVFGKKDKISYFPSV